MDTTDLISKVIESMKTSTQLRPTVYAEIGGAVKAIPLLNFIGDSRMKAHILFLEGRQAGQRDAGQELTETTFITEVWLTPGQRNPTPGQRPPAHIQHKEGVMFAVSKNAAPFETLVKIYEIIRDKKKRPVELVYMSESVDKEGLMGLAFIAGWRSRNMSKAEVERLQPLGMRAFLK